MKRVKSKSHNQRKIMPIIGAIIVLLLVVSGGFYYFSENPIKFTKDKMFLASTTNYVELYNEKGEVVEEVIRGSEVNYIKDYNIEGLYYVEYQNKDYYIKDETILKELEEEVVLEKNTYVRTPQNLYENETSPELSTLVNKGEQLTILGYDYLLEDGSVNMYKVKYGEVEGYIYEKYTEQTLEAAQDVYQRDTYYTVHEARGNSFGGGNAANLDYFPVEKGNFANNVMPEEVRALYLNSSSTVLGNVDEYIALAKESNINAFVVDIKDNKVPGYQSEVMKTYSPTNYNNAYNTVENYQTAITKLKEAGFYVIGRITVFKDEYYTIDHPEHAITDTRTNQQFMHNGTYWPSPYQRDVWEFNVKLALEAVELFGFNEIQFDYVRFPDRTGSAESYGIVDFKNIYQEEKAQAIQRFLQYATDELHKKETYISVDVFGESAYTYVTAYGQYLPAISNVVDVVSPMPYPDHFNKYDFGFTVPVWTVPYDLMYYWGSNYVAKRQTEIPSPAAVRSWIQTYDAIKEPYITYGAQQVTDQIQGLYDAGLSGGYLTWNSGSNINKYRSQLDAYKKEY